MNKPQKIFLSGPISTRLDTYKAEFDKAAEIVADAGHIPLNPAWMPLGLQQKDYMRISMAMLESADLLVAHPDWAESKGATIERTYAEKVGIPVMSWGDFLAAVTPQAPAVPSCEVVATTRRLETVDLAKFRDALGTGRASDILRPFDMISVHLTNGDTVAIQCAFVGTDYARFIFLDCVGDFMMNDEPTNEGGYYKSQGRKAVLEEIYPLLPAELRAMIRPRTIRETINGETVEYADPLWLPSATDVFGSPKDKWWPDENDSFHLPIFTRERNRVKECGDHGSYPWWLRSVFATYTTNFCIVYSDGGAYYTSAYYSYGFAPGFDIAKS